MDWQYSLVKLVPTYSINLNSTLTNTLMMVSLVMLKKTSLTRVTVYKSLKSHPSATVPTRISMSPPTTTVTDGLVVMSVLLDTILLTLPNTLVLLEKTTFPIVLLLLLMKICVRNVTLDTS